MLSELGMKMAEWLRNKGRAMPERGITKEMLLTIGPPIWSASYRHETDDLAAHQRLVASLRAAFLGGDDIAGAFLATLEVPVEQLATLGSGLWCDQGFPQITLGHKYAASLMATKIAPSVLPYIEAPWRCFHLEVPAGLLQIEHEQLGKAVDVKGALVMRMKHVDGSLRWGYLAYTDTSLSLHRFGMRAEKLMSIAESEEVPFGERLTDLDSRCAELLARLIFGVCMAYTEKGNVTPPKARNPSEKKRKSDLPTCRTYILGKDKVVSDCREAVRDYLHGRKGKSPSVQTLVAGHWKSQAWGEHASKRKIIWIQPYWRGPEDAPIAANVRVVRE